MAKNVRISDNLYALAQVESLVENRSIAQQLEYWAKLGMAVASARTAASELGSVNASIEATRRLDALDVRRGARDASYFHFIPASAARDSTVVFPSFSREKVES
jgi:hypothetical protein